MLICVAGRGSRTTVARSAHVPTYVFHLRPQGTLKHNLSGHSNFVVSVDFHPKTYELASGSYDTKLFLWDVAGEKGKIV